MTSAPRPLNGDGANTVTEAEAVYRADLGLDATLSRACQHPAMSGAFTVCTDV